MAATSIPARRPPLTPEDWQYLESITGKRGSNRQIASVCFAALFLILACLRIYLAFWIAGRDGYTAQAFLSRFSAGTSMDETYSGTFIKAADSLTHGTLLFVVALAYVASWWNGRKNRERSQRILNALHGMNAL